MKLAKYAIIDFRTDAIIIEELNKYTDKIIKTKKQNTYDSICGHADIQLCKIDDNTAVCAPNCYEYFKSQLQGINVICGDKNPCGLYPTDVLYNACCFGDYAIHNFKYTDKITLAVIEQKFSKRINVKQGYSKCSICHIGNAVITDDDGIPKKLCEFKLDVLKLKSKDVNLNGMNYGFFGGAVGTFKNYIFSVGSIEKHSDAKCITKFLNKHNFNLIELSKNPLYDVGSIIFF